MMQIVKRTKSRLVSMPHSFFLCRDEHQRCVTSFTSTLDMSREDVIYGSKVGNTTNPQFLEVDNWVKY